MPTFSVHSSIRWWSVSWPALHRGHLSFFDSFRLVRRMLVGSWLWLKSQTISAFFSFDFGHPTPDGSPVEVRFRNLCSLWLSNVGDQVIVGGAVIGCS